jgi:hypothetical protein
MFLVRSITPRELDAAENLLAAAVAEGRERVPSLAVYTDGLYHNPEMALLIREDGRELIEAVLPGGWGPCTDAEDYDWFLWAGSPFADMHRGLRLASLGGGYKAYSTRPRNDYSTPLPLFADA